MRWRKLNQNHRIIKRFAIFPIEIDKIRIWLETVYIIQRYSAFSEGWINDGLTDRKTYLEWKRINRNERKISNDK